MLEKQARWFMRFWFGMAFHPSSDFADEEGNNVKKLSVSLFSHGGKDFSFSFSFYIVRFELGRVLVYHFCSVDVCFGFS